MLSNSIIISIAHTRLSSSFTHIVILLIFSPGKYLSGEVEVKQLFIVRNCASTISTHQKKYWDLVMLWQWPVDGKWCTNNVLILVSISDFILYLGNLFGFAFSVCFFFIFATAKIVEVYQVEEAKSFCSSCKMYFEVDLVLCRKRLPIDVGIGSRNVEEPPNW